jgi:hypothetical protein
MLRGEAGKSRYDLAHRAEKWTRSSALDDVPLKRMGIGPKGGIHFWSDALTRLHLFIRKECAYGSVAS